MTHPSRKNRRLRRVLCDWNGWKWGACRAVAV